MDDEYFSLESILADNHVSTLPILEDACAAKVEDELGDGANGRN